MLGAAHFNDDQRRSAIDLRVSSCTCLGLSPSVMTETCGASSPVHMFNQLSDL